LLNITFPENNSKLDDRVKQHNLGMLNKLERRSENNATARSQSALLARNYVLAFNDVLAFPDSILSAYIRSHHNSESVLSYLCQACTYDEFDVLYKILSRCYCSEDEINRSEKLLGIFKIGNRDILIEAAKSKPDVSAIRKSWSDEPMEETKQKLEDARQVMVYQDDVLDFILCGSAEKAQVMGNTSKLLGLSYIPFRFAR
jgi:hypothetical protein